MIFQKKIIMRVKNLSLKNKINYFNGFTLIEIMVVMVIIGVILSFVTLSVGSNSLARTMEQEAQRLTYLLKLAHQEAVMKSQEIGLSFFENGYKFYILQNEKWQLIQNDDKTFQPRQIPAIIQMTLLISGQVVDMRETQDAPQLFILSSGELTPFEILWTTESDESLRYRIVGNSVGKIILDEHID